jgi:hypothetical protein
MGQFRVLFRGIVVHSLVIAVSLLLSGVSFGAETPVHYVYEMYITRPNIHDTGYAEWSGSTIYRPENAWLGK